MVLKLGLLLLFVVGIGGKLLTALADEAGPVIARPITESVRNNAE